MDGAKNPISSLLNSLLPVPPLLNVSLAIGNVSVTKKNPVCPPASNQPSKGSSATNGSKDAGADKGSSTTNGSKDQPNGSKDAGADKGSSATNGSKDKP